MKNKITLAILSLFLIFLIACQQTAKTETAAISTPATNTPATGTTGDAAVDAVGSDLNITNSVANDLSTDDLGSLDSGLSDIQNI